MAPSRGKGKARVTAARRIAAPSTRRSSRSTRSSQASVPDVYQDMLAGAAAAEPTPDPDRPLKRRKALREVSVHRPGPTASKGKQPAGPAGEREPARGVQNIETSLDDDNDENDENEDDESDFAFEDVDLSRPSVAGPADAEDAIGDVSIPVEQTLTSRKQTQVRKKPISAAEKAHRLVVHKANVLCLLGHCIHVNSWCNDTRAQQCLEPLLTPKMKLYLTPKSDLSQFDWNRLFMDGLHQVLGMFRLRFRVTASGLRRTRWATDGEEQYNTADDANSTDHAEFIRAASTLDGSQDTGNQLFCALLRAAGVEARLVCSLQPLPFTTIAATTSPKKVAMKPTIFAIASDIDPKKGERCENDTAVNSSMSIGNVPSARRRLGQPTFSPMNSNGPPLVRESKTSIRKLSFPIFWVEAFNAAHQKWIPLDPIVTGTFNKPSRLEPPWSYELNQLSYAVAFESSGVAKDVTRRYAKAYNAKTRRLRVECTGDEGIQWWRRTMRFFRRRGGQLDREQVEDAELAQREAREGMPSNLEDFKEHPMYALERHLRRHEVIHPKREVGKVNAGTAAKPRMEVVYRRRDVVACRSADKWYRLGRVVKKGEQPLKQIAIAHSRRARALSEEGSEGHGQRMTGLYAQYQTELYIPPPVSPSGRIPRNTFGNLDVYVPSMVPAGGVHVHHPLTAQAAKLLRVDYADAVTGFQFKGRQGTAVIEGAVVSEGHSEAVKAVIEGLEYEDEWQRAKARSAVALRGWKRFLTGLRIAERVAEYGTMGGKVAEEEKEAKVENDKPRRDATNLLPSIKADEELLTAGKYSIDDLITIGRKTGPKKRLKRALENEEEEVDGQEENMTDYEMEEYGEGGFLAEDAVEVVKGGCNFLHIGGPEGSDGENEGGFIPDDRMNASDDGFDGFLPNDSDRQEDEDEGGTVIFPNFDAEEPGDTGGGFLPDASNNSGSSHNTVRADAETLLGVGHEVDNDESDGGALKRHGALDGLPPAHVAHEIDLGLIGVRIDSNPLHTTTGLDGASGGPYLGNISHDADEVELDEDGFEGERVEGEQEMQSDQDSLLTHDPEDEDAEPDWLESD